MEHADRGGVPEVGGERSPLTRQVRGRAAAAILGAMTSDSPRDAIRVGPAQVRTISNFVDASRCRAWVDRAWADQTQWKKRFDYIHSYGRAWYLELEYGMLHVYHAEAAATNALLAGLDGLVPALAACARHLEAPDGSVGLPSRPRWKNLGPYWGEAGVIAMTRGTAGYVHADYEGLSPYPARIFDPATRAYSAVLMLARPASGGHLKVWTRRFLGNERQALEDCPSEVAEYDTGTLALFDSFCYHQIQAAELDESSPFRAVAAMHFLYVDQPHPHWEYWY